MNFSSIFTFGKYKGRSIENVWTGRISGNESEIVSAYLKELFQMLLNPDDKHKLKLFTSLDLGACKGTIEHIRSVNPSFNVVIAGNYIILESYKKRHSDFRKIINLGLASEFNNVNSNLFKNLIGTQITKWADFTESSRKFICLQSDPSYFKFCIENVNDFYLSPEQIDRLNRTPSRSLSKFILTDIEDDLIKFSPLFTEYQYTLVCH